MMLRTKLRNKFLKQKTTETRSAYNKQRNICVSILRKAKRSYFENLDIKNLSDNRKFWGTVKPLFSNKVRSNDYITLNKNDLLIRNEYKIANIFNTFFVNIVPNLGIEIDQQYLSNVSNISDPVEKAIKKYQKHPSISIINKMVSSVENEASFSFTCVTVDDISKEIKRLDIKKAIQEGDIPTKVIKQFPNLFIDSLIPVSLKVPSLMILKRQWFIQFIKKNAKLKSLTTYQLAFCRISLKYMKDSYMTKCILISIHFLYNISAVFERAIMRNIAS